MAERYRFSVAYEPATLHAAVRAYVWKTHMGGTHWVPTGVVFIFVVGLSYYLLANLYGVLAGVIAGAVAAVLIGLGVYSWMAARARDAKLALMKEPRAEFVILDDAVEVKTDRGSGRLPWATIQQIWKFKRVWLLMMDSNRFVTLPLAEAPAGALQFLDEKIQPRPLGAA